MPRPLPRIHAGLSKVLIGIYAFLNKKVMASMAGACAGHGCGEIQDTYMTRGLIQMATETEHLSKHISSGGRTSICKSYEHLSNIYRQLYIEHLSSIYRTSTKTLSNIYRKLPKSIERLSKIWRTSIPKYLY